MPELPEVETTILGLKKKVLGRTFVDVWTDFEKLIKRPKGLEAFKKEIKGKKIENVARRGKNILFHLSGGKILLIHQKMTGHLLFGNWELEDGVWKSKIPGPLAEDKMNKFLHLIFWLDGKKMMALSDLRKFAKVELWSKEELEKSEGFVALGPEPLENIFDLEKFKERLDKKRNGKIKQVLMDQAIIAGIGNIYSDEILWRAKINPFRAIKTLSAEELKRIYHAMKDVLPKAVEVGGESISDYRTPSGEKGGFDALRKVYRREGEKCGRCGTKIKRAKLGGRSAHFCPKCQL